MVVWVRTVDIAFEGAGPIMAAAIEPAPTARRLRRSIEGMSGLRAMGCSLLLRGLAASFENLVSSR
jgi:hypothetical protein